MVFEYTQTLFQTRGSVVLLLRSSRVFANRTPKTLLNNGIVEKRAGQRMFAKTHGNGSPRPTTEKTEKLFGPSATSVLAL